MKIALICTEKLPVPPVAGGAIQIYIEGILPKLSKYHDVTIFSVKHDSLPDEEVRSGVRYIRLATSDDDKFEYVRNVKQRLDEDYDLIHVFNRPRWVVSLSKKLPNTKFSLSLHNEMFHTKKIPAEMAIACINRVEFIATVSDFIADGVRKLYPIADKKLHTVYSGVSVDLYTPAMSIEGAKNKEALKKKFGIENKKVVIFVGRLGVKKGVDKLIDTMKIVMNKRSNVALVIVGSKWYGSNTKDEYTQSIVESSKFLDGPIVFTGFLPPSEIPPYYNMGDVFVCPSQWEEPLARVHYEAMAAGLPIVTTNRGGNAEVIEGFGNGYVIDDYSNPETFASRIIELLDNPAEASKIGQKGRAISEELYNWNRVSNDVLSLISKINESVVDEEFVCIGESPADEESEILEDDVTIEDVVCIGECPADEESEILEDDVPIEDIMCIGECTADEESEILEDDVPIEDIVCIGESPADEESEILENVVTVKEAEYVDKNEVVDEGNYVDDINDQPENMYESVWVDNSKIDNSKIESFRHDNKTTKKDKKVKEQKSKYTYEPVWVENSSIFEEPKFIKETIKVNDNKEPKVTRIQKIYIIPRSKKSVEIFESEDDELEVVQKKKSPYDPSVPPIVEYYLEKCKHYFD